MAFFVWVTWRPRGRISNHSCSLRTSKFQTQNSCLTSASIVIRGFKHDTSGRPFSVILENAEDVEFCPVIYLQQYASLRGTTPGALFCFADGAPVKTIHFTQQLRQALIFCGLDSRRYKSHSFRIGAASWAAEKGLSDAQIRHLGRWKSDAFKLYIRQTNSQINGMQAL